MIQWHACSAKQALEELRSGPGGLTGAEAARRLVAHGPNRLARKKDKSFPARLLGQLKDPMILVLLVAAALSLWASGGEDWLDAAIILGIVAVNAIISLSQEDSARKALEALSQMSAPAARSRATSPTMIWRLTPSSPARAVADTGWADCSSRSRIWALRCWAFMGFPLFQTGCL